MRLWPWTRKKTRAQANAATPPRSEQHAVIAYIMPEAGVHPDETWSVDGLEDALTAAIARHGVGEFDGDGHDLETGVLEVFTYGPDADRLATIVSDVLAGFSKGPGSYLMKRYGDVGVREVRVEL